MKGFPDSQGLFNTAVNYDTSVTWKNPTSHKMSSAQRQRKTGQPVISMTPVATRPSERVLSFLLVLSLFPL